MAYTPHPPDDRVYWDAIVANAKGRGSDGCTLVGEHHQECCFEHDINWSGTTLEGDPISKEEANLRFKACIQSRSIFGRFSPMSYWRFFGVTLGAWFVKLLGRD